MMDGCARGVEVCSCRTLTSWAAGSCRYPPTAKAGVFGPEAAPTETPGRPANATRLIAAATAPRLVLLPISFAPPRNFQNRRIRLTRKRLNNSPPWIGKGDGSVTDGIVARIAG